MYRTIVAGTDGSASAKAAVDHAVALAKLCGAKVHLVTAYTPVEAYVTTPEAASMVAAMGSPTDTAQIVIDEAAEQARASGAEVETHVCRGDAAGALIEVAESIGADLIVVGNRGMTGKARFLLGSVPNKVSHHAPCTVMIVRTT